jgi:uncharacterized protein YukE
MSETAAADQKVANPAYLDLERLRGRIVQAAPALRGALDRPARDMSGGKVWTGPAASRFAHEVTGRSQRLGTLVERLISAIDAELRSTPRECTQQEAASYRRSRRLDRY